MEYARVDGAIVREIIEPAFDGDGLEIPIEQRFHADIVSTLVSEASGMVLGGTWDGSSFGPQPPPPPPPSLSERKAAISRRFQDDDALKALLGVLDDRLGQVAGKTLADILARVT